MKKEEEIRASFMLSSLSSASLVSLLCDRPVATRVVDLAVVWEILASRPISTALAGFGSRPA